MSLKKEGEIGCLIPDGNCISTDTWLSGGVLLRVSFWLWRLLRQLAHRAGNFLPSIHPEHDYEYPQSIACGDMRFQRVRSRMNWPPLRGGIGITRPILRWLRAQNQYFYGTAFTQET